MKIHLTPCCKEKSEAARIHNIPLPPEEMYIEPEIQEFFRVCQAKHLTFGVLSDLYGAWVSPEKKHWYQKPPDAVSPQEEQALIWQFDERLQAFDEIIFYIRQGPLHRFYDTVLTQSRLADRIRRINTLSDL